jgi:hypothetical protein
MMHVSNKAMPNQGNYSGDMVDQWPHGIGTMRYDGGRIYSGQWE